jgi:hypothetical protein
VSGEVAAAGYLYEHLLIQRELSHIRRAELAERIREAEEKKQPSF